MVSAILAILLSYTFIGENFIVWIIPFMAVLVALSKVGSKLYWMISLVAFFYGITNSLLPLYLLPLTPWIGEQLTEVMNLLRPYRIAPSGPAAFTPHISIGTVFLAPLGVLSSLLFVILLLEALFTPSRRYIDEFLAKLRFKK